MSSRSYTFRLVLHEQGDVQDVVVVGAHSVLGCWSPDDSGLKLTKSDQSTYSGAVLVAPAVFLSGEEYKYAFRRAGQANWTWESCNNRILAPILINQSYCVFSTFNTVDSATAFAKIVSFNLRFDNPGTAGFSQVSCCCVS